MRSLAVILLVFAVSASGSGALVHLHRAQHAGHAHPPRADAVSAERGHDCCDHSHHRDAGSSGDASRDIIASGTGGEDDSHCQTCLDLISRIVIAETPMTTITCRSTGIFIAPLEWQVAAVARSHHIESTGPPCF